MGEGWIKLDRKILDWEWYSDLPVKTLFIHLILSANHLDQNWHGIQIRRGQLISGRYALSAATGLTEQQIRTALKKLTLTKEIVVKSTRHNSLITVCKYDDYQLKENGTNQRPTNNQPTTNQQSTTNKNVRMIRMKENNNAALPQSELPFKSDEFVFAWNEWVVDRKERNKKITPRAMAMQFKFLKTKTEGHAIEIINHAIQQGWQGLYEIRAQKEKKSNPGKLQ